MNNFTQNSEYPTESVFSVAGKNFTVAKQRLEAYVEAQILENQPRNWTKFDLCMEEMIAIYEQSQPVRKIRASRRSITGWLNGHPEHDPVPFESTIERDCAYQLMFDKRVRSVQSQPLTITFSANTNGDRSYTPDYLVEYMAGTRAERVIIECKPEAYWLEHKTRLQARYEYVGQWAKERDMRFVMLTDRDVQGVSLDNIKILYPHLLMGPSPSESHAEFQPDILKAIPATNFEILEAVKHLFPNRAAAQTEILVMLANSQIFCDLHSKLDMTTLYYSQEDSLEVDFLFDKGIDFSV